MHVVHAYCYSGEFFQKINQKFSTSPDQFSTLQSMVEAEASLGQHTNSNSATMALLWLKRYESVTMATTS